MALTLSDQDKAFLREIGIAPEKDVSISINGTDLSQCVKELAFTLQPISEVRRCEGWMFLAKDSDGSRTKRFRISGEFKWP